MISAAFSCSCDYGHRFELLMAIVGVASSKNSTERCASDWKLYLLASGGTLPPALAHLSVFITKLRLVRTIQSSVAVAGF